MGSQAVTVQHSILYTVLLAPQKSEIIMSQLTLCVVFVAVFSCIEAHSAGSRRLLQEETVWQDAKQGFTSAIDSFWGGQCVAEAQCADYVATCSSQGECRPVWWMWMILVSLVLSLIVPCVCCICCGICSCIKDCICCCR